MRTSWSLYESIGRQNTVENVVDLEGSSVGKCVLCGFLQHYPAGCALSDLTVGMCSIPHGREQGIDVGLGDTKPF